MSVPSASLELRRGELVLTTATAVAALAGLGIQLGLALADPGPAGVAHATVRYLSYFTILSNLLVALACGLALVGRGTAVGAFVGRPSVRTAIVLYIVVTGLVWSALLARYYHPHGVRWCTNALMHYAVPVLYPALWIAYVPHGRLVWSDAARWLIFPAAYLGWTLARGAWSSEYPYGFVDVGQLGMTAVLRNATGLFVVFLVLGLGLVAIDRWLGRRATRAA